MPEMAWLAEKVADKRKIGIKNIENGFGVAEMGGFLSKGTSCDFRNFLEGKAFPSLARCCSLPLSSGALAKISVREIILLK